MQIPAISGKRILICPLDWGLGHAARCVPLIKQLQQNNHIIIGCNEWQQEFFEKEISNVEYAPLFGYNVKYSEKISLGLKMLSQFPRLSLTVRKENAWLKKFLEKNKIDVVISDNRFGLYNKNVESIFITHQLFVPAPFLKTAVNKINAIFIKKFDACWVPDNENEKNSLSGNLSHGGPIPENVRYIGPLSRFTIGKRVEQKDAILILLSGVEPQRSILEEKLGRAFSQNDSQVALVRGTSRKSFVKFPAHFTVHDVADTATLEALLKSSKHIICRSGYSTLMDLHALRLKAMLVPTPGQTEQEYLAEYWNKKFGFLYMAQEKITRDSILGLLEEKDPALQKRSA